MSKPAPFGFAQNEVEGVGSGLIEGVDFAERALGRLGRPPYWPNGQDLKTSLACAYTL